MTAAASTRVSRLPQRAQPTRPQRSKRGHSAVGPYDRADEAHQLRVGGMAWAEVARSVGYVSGQVAQMAVTAYLQKAAIERTPEQRQLALQLELDRLDALQAALWDRAGNGDLRAAMVILQISDRRVRLERLDRVADERANVQDTNWISPGPEMADHMRHVILEREREKVRNGGDPHFMNILERSIEARPVLSADLA